MNGHVSWDRGDLPRGKGKVVEVKQLNGGNLHMVRDKNNAVFALREDQLTQEVS